MVIIFLLCGIIFLLGGVYLERYKWVSAARNDKAMCVDGEFFKVKRFNPDVKS